MDDIRIVCSEERGTWNVIVNGEWYFEGTYEQCCDVADTYYAPSDKEYYGDDGDADYKPWEDE